MMHFFLHQTSPVSIAPCCQIDVKSGGLCADRAIKCGSCRLFLCYTVPKPILKGFRAWKNRNRIQNSTTPNTRSNGLIFGYIHRSCSVDDQSACIPCGLSSIHCIIVQQSTMVGCFAAKLEITAFCSQQHKHIFITQLVRIRWFGLIKFS